MGKLIRNTLPVAFVGHSSLPSTAELNIQYVSIALQCIQILHQSLLEPYKESLCLAAHVSWL